MRKPLLILLFVVFCGMTCSQAWGATYYVRDDGGTCGGASPQCLGTTDAKYSGSGTNGACACKHPYYVTGWWQYGDAATPTGGQVGIMTNGDDVIIKQGTYVIGNDPNGLTFGCGTSTRGCLSRILPSGTESNPTKIIGCGSSGCGTGTKPKLTATGRTYWTFNVQSKSWITFDSLDLTDGAACATAHDVYSCGTVDINEKTGFDGIRIGYSSNIVINNSDIHGFYRYGLWGGKLSNLTVTDTRINYNGSNGWEMDNQNNDSSNSGTITFSGSTPVTSNHATNKCTINFNGCVEDPNVPNTIVPDGCARTNADGFGSQNSSGVFSFTQCDISFNGHDGLDFLYLNKGGITGGTLTVKRSRLEGNRGNAIKGPNNMTLEDNLIIGNCGWHIQNTASASPLMETESCRASGNTIVIAWRNSSTIEPQINNNTITTNGTAAIIIEGPDTNTTCPSTVDINAANNIFLGGRVFNSSSNISDLCYNSAFGDFGKNCIPELLLSNNSCTGEQDTGRNCAQTNASSTYLQTAVTGNQYNATATTVFTGTISQGPSTFYTGTNYIDQLKIKNTGIAYNTADETVVGLDDKDINNFDRDAADGNWDAGGLEYGTIGTGGGAAACPAETRSNCDLDATASGASDGTCSSGYSGACSYSCLDGAWTLSSNTCVIQNCGNAQIDAGEECDGALLNDATCASEGYSSCAGTPTCTNCLLTQGSCQAYQIGNNCLDPGEQCEDGNTTNHDGCSELGETETANYQHFKADYTESDTPGVLTVTTHKVQATGITHVADSSVSDDFGASHFGNFTHRFKAQIDSCQDNGLGEDGGMAVWAMSGGSYGDTSEMETADDGIALKIKCFSSIERNTWELIEYE